jgi:hypothetical protein
MMRTKLCHVDLTVLEVQSLLGAIGNSLTGEPDDESSIVGSATQVRAAYRGQAKLVRALRRAKQEVES